ncbi:hypothetical protein TeGR_g9773 [Tetraparma gracilis]|uniref:Uncharacterized protein n=1 Tax=Tetraparma gracilis TaxID=2962635 RepID=A0ABQ6MFI4_9STRA|nr:hypothetical protein TeGR_g9773 [Tetraparma gracilis]
MLTNVHPASEMLQNLAGDLKEIVRKRLVERIVGGGGGDDTDGELQFSHKFVQESIYESCLVSNRKQVHRAIAKYLELDQSKQLSDNYGLIAHHYVQAEEWRNACLYLQLSSEVSARLEMPESVVTSLTQWKKIREEKLGKTEEGHGEAINGRFGSARKEAGIVYITLGNALKMMHNVDDALAMYALGAESLGRKLPASKLARVRIIVRGVALLQWMAMKGGSYKTDDNAAEEEAMLSQALTASAQIMFRHKNDALGFLSLSLFILLHTSRPTATMVKFASQFGSFIAPLLGLTRVSEHLTMEVNRLASQCTGKDGVVASAFLNFSNGMAYGAKGELRQAAGFFAAAAKVSLELRDLQEWGNNLSYCMSSNAIAVLQLYDYARAGGAATLGGVKAAKLLGIADFYTSFMEKLAKKYPIASGWAPALRGALLARTGKRGAAMKLFEKAEEAALKISGKACLCYLYLERGYLEDGGAVKQFASSGSLSGASVAKAAVVSPERETRAEEGSCIKSFAAAADLADETGMHRLGDLAKERLRRLNVDTGVEGGITRQTTSALVVGVRAPEGGRRASGRRASGQRASGRMVSGRRASGRRAGGHTHNMDLNAALIKNAGEMERRMPPAQAGRRASRKGSAVGFASGDK